MKFGVCVVGSATMLREIVALTRPTQASAAISSDPFRIPTRPPNSTCWDEVDLNHDGMKPSHPLDTCSIVPTPPPSQWQESAKGIGGDAPALRAAGNTQNQQKSPKIPKLANHQKSPICPRITRTPIRIGVATNIL